MRPEHNIRYGRLKRKVFFFSAATGEAFFIYACQLSPWHYVRYGSPIANQSYFYVCGDGSEFLAISTRAQASKL